MWWYHLTVVFIYVGFTTAQIIYGLYRFNEMQKQQIVAIHNYLRAQEPASNMQELVWDERLADLAFGHVQRCDAWHRSAYERQGYGYSYIGENIWWSNEAYLRPNPQSAMLDFYNEKPFYNYNTTHCWIGAQCGHYTQFVWAETCAIGCAAVHCNGIRNGRGISQGHIIVCNYGEGGNHYQQRPYLLGPRCSNCRCGGGCTLEGLCPPCCTGIRYPTYGTFLPLQRSSLSELRQNIGVRQRQISDRSGISKLHLYECNDLEPYCDYWASTVGCNGYHQIFMKKQCPRTCNTCHRPPTSTFTRGRSNHRNSLLRPNLLLRPLLPDFRRINNR